MKICEWNTDYSVGVHLLDSHHQKLFDLLNDLYMAMWEGAEDKEFIRIIDELLDYTHYHFEEEEKVMRMLKYPYFAEHQLLHQNFVRVVKELHEASHKGLAVFVATKVSGVGLEWLKVHISLADRKYYEYMRERGLEL
jgi:hemerythrin-like metal-binding protein